LPDVKECDSSPCQNDGWCTDLINDYNCTCSEAFTGKNCSIGEIKRLIQFMLMKDTVTIHGIFLLLEMAFLWIHLLSISVSLCQIILKKLKKKIFGKKRF